MAENLWNEEHARKLSGVAALVHRSHLLGRDRSVANWGGGNTSMKAVETDFRGETVDVLWVKGSGSDLATVAANGFAGLYMQDMLLLQERRTMSDEEMVAYLSHCLLDPTMPRQSIETLMHAFLPFTHIDHTHPDNIIALATSVHGEDMAREIYGDELIWLPYVRPGFQLARDIAFGVRDNNKARLVVMARHGLVTWGDTSRECYEHTLEMINRAGAYIADRARGRAAFGGVRIPPVEPSRRQELLAQALPSVRGAVSRRSRMIIATDQAPETLEFVGGAESKTLALTGAACPDHLVHTKYVPLWVDYDPQHGEARDLVRALERGVQEYAQAYRHYFEENPSQGFPMDDPAPRVILIPGVGMLTTGKDAARAEISAALYQRAIQVMRGASAIDRYVSLTPAEAYGVEYWPLERYKLTLQPAERELARRVAFVTGGASGIGRAIAERFAQEGAHVVIADVDAAKAEAVAADLTDKHGFRRGMAVECDVTREESVADAFRETVFAYGGVDIVVSNAGLASAHPVEETSVAEWQGLFDVLARGYFLVARAAFQVWRTQGIGGSLLFVASKNALVPGKRASAYSAAKAAELHLARVLAEEGGADGIRVNSLCPDAVIQGSGIWTSGWKEMRAKEHGIRPDQVEEFYRERTTLKVNVYPSDVAEAALFLVSDRSAKTTGAVLTVDGGIPAAYVR